MRRFFPLFLLLLLIWIVFFVEAHLGLVLSDYGIFPRTTDGMIGILCWPLLHGDYAHVSSNLLSLLIFGGIISAQDRVTFVKLTIYITIMAGAGVWLIGRPAIHIGASGLVFGYFGFVVLRALYDRRILSIIISILVILAFGSIVWGVFPIKAETSWEGHLCGLAAGGLFARYTRRKRTSKGARL